MKSGIGDNMNFVYGSKLAELQERIWNNIISGNPQSADDIDVLFNNIWIWLAYFLAPSNLVLRNLCLEALLKFDGETCENYPDKIYKTFIRLAFFRKHAEPLWAEGYSYFGYTKSILDRYLTTYESYEINSEIVRLCISIERNFVYSSYDRNGKPYPAPYGDLWDVGIVTVNGWVGDVICKVGNVTKAGVLYKIKAWPIGLNCHAPKSRSKFIIACGVPQGFHFYEGYGNKYKNLFQELCDMFDPRRILSLLRIWTI